MNLNKIKKVCGLSAALLLAVNALSAQEIAKKELRLPEEVLGLKVLKCDFHLHTIFSDGDVWPTTRVEEAFAEGLDAISITDHIEYRPRVESIANTTVSQNAGYEAAKNAAKIKGITLVPGTEITKEVAPGHFNALFIKDADEFNKCINKENPRDGKNIRKDLQVAREQGAFIQWNHPWYGVKNNECIWFPIIDSLCNEGLIDGIEVINATKYDPIILGWAQDKKLTNMGNTDLHAPAFQYLDGNFRTMTFVFAKDNSLESIKEALFNKQTLSYCRNFVYGDKKYMEPLFQNSLELEISSDGKNSGALSIKNNSSLEYKISIIGGDELQLFSYTRTLTVPKLGETTVGFKVPKGIEKGKNYSVKISVNNMHIAPETPLDTELGITL